MKKEQLIALGIDEEVAKQVMSLHGADITKAKSDVSSIKPLRSLKLKLTH